MPITDTAVGAILEIPSKAMAQIKRANDALLTLHESSRNAADQIYGDFARRMPDGVQKFIDKLAEAKKAMDGLGTVNVTLNTGAAVSEGQKLSTQMQKTSADVSKAVQDMSASWSDLGKVNIKGFDISKYGNNLTEVLARLDQLKQDFKNEPIGSGRNQSMADEIRQLEEAVRLYKQAAEEKNKALANIQQKQQNEKDKAYLDEQKRLLDRILQLRKDISQISISVQRGTITGKTDMSADLAQLEKLRKELRETGWAYRDLRTFQSQAISEDARIKAEIQSQNAKNAGLRQEVDERNKLAAAITRANELTAQGQQGKTRLGSGEEAAIQRQLNSDYKNQLKILKEIGEIKAKAAEQGKTLTINSAEVQLIQALEQRYRVYAEDVNRVAGAYRAMGEAAAKNFAADRSEQLARNAIMLADAQKKAAGNTNQLTAEYKRLYAENQKLAASMDKIDWGKISPATMGTQSYQNMSAAWSAMEVQARANQDRMAEIARKNIDEVNEFKRQKEMEANQKSISDFVQAEAQKKAAALQAAQEESNARKQALQAYLQSYQGAMAQADKIMSGRGGTSMFATNIENIKRAINDLKAASGSLNLLNPADVTKAEQLKRKIAELETLLKKYKDAATPDKPVISPQDAINAAKNATTLKQLEKAYKDLKESMSGVDSSKPIWTQMNTQLGQTKSQIDDIKKKMGEFHNEVQKTSNIMGNLQSRIAAAFSVGAIMGFAKKVTEVRAQFELQRVALGAIIQDKDEANKVFLRVQQMALESPFSIMQLERSTKQIAAFGFEAKQLVPTMKMVADIGAGLGVELDRIVLVLGHMKARGYLEGTMVRQFTNMGFNVLGELAKYYTELEGRMVSVSDVQERVKKKMVEFGDVEEVLKRVTSAGGMFYDMQKKQSDSIWGQMQRITDAYDLMLNEIGKDNEGAIKTALSAIRSLINSWRTIAPMLKDIAYTMGGIFAIKGAIAMVWQLNKLGIMVQGLALGWRGVAAAASRAATSMKLAWSSTGIGLLVAGVITAIEVIRGLNAEANALNEELGKIGEDNVKNLNDSIAQFVELADVMSSSSKTYNERAEAMKDMKRVFSDILPIEKMEMDYIKGLNGNYTELIDTIAKYYQEKEYQQKYETIAESEQAKESRRLIEETFERMNEDNKLGLIFSDDQIKAWADTLAAELNSGKLNNSIESIKKRVQEIFPDAKNIDSYFSEAYGKSDFTDVIDAVAKVRDTFGNISLSTADAANAMAMYNELLGRMDFSQLDTEYEKVQQRINDIQERQSTLKELIPLAAPDVSKKYQEELADLQIQLTNYTNLLDSVEQAQGRVLAQGFYDEVDKDTKRLTGLVQTYWDLGIEMKDLLKSGIQPTDKAYKDLEAQQKKVRDSADELKTSHTAVNWTLIDNANSTYELNGQLTQIASDAFPNVSKRVVEMSNNLQLAFAKSKKTLYGFMMALADILPDSWKSKLPDYAKSYNMAVNEIAALEGKLGENTQSGNEALNERGKLYSDIATRNIEKYGAQTKRINEITKDSQKTSKDMAKDLRNEAKAWNEYVTAYEKSTNKESALKGMGLTKADIEQYRKNAKAANAIADELWGEEKKGGKQGGHGKDAIKELWQNRIDAMNRYYDAAEKARKHLSESETATEQRGSMSGLWSSLGLNNIKGLSLDDLIGKGFDPNKLKGDYVDALNELLKLIPAKYTDLRNKVQETIASKSIEIKFKLKEESEGQLEKDLDRLFDSYDLSKTLKDANIPINLVPMVGGEPIASLDELRDRIQKQFEAEGGENASENRVKEYKDALKKIDDMEVKQQQERLKSYQQYLAAMYSDRAQTMIKSYTTMKNMERDFAAYRANLEKEAADPATTEARKQQIAQQIAMLEQQSKDAIAGVKNEMDQKLNQFDWNAFKGSPVFTQMYSDLQTLSKQGIDMLIGKLTVMREKLQSMENVDYRAVREITQYINKLNDARIDTASWKELFDIVQESRRLNAKGMDMGTAEENLMDSQTELDSLNAMIDDLQTVIALKDKEGDESANTANLTADQLALYGESKEDLQEILKGTQKNAAAAQGSVDKWSEIIDKHKRAQAALKRQTKIAQDVKDGFDKIYDSSLELAEALGADTDVWGDFGKAVSNMIFTVIMLTIQFYAMGVAANSSMGIIGWIAIALQTIVQLLVAIFAMHDKSLQKRIEEQQEKVEQLERAYDKLKDAVDNAFEAERLRSDSRKAVQNIKDRIEATEEMIRLEEQKKKVDKDQIKEWKEDIEDLNDELDEFKDNVTEAWGGFGSDDNYQSAVEDFTSAWLDAFNETGDGLDALNDKWDEYIDNLIKKQIGLAVMGPRIKRFMKMIDSFVGEGSDEGEYLSKSELDKLKALRLSTLDGINEEMKLYLEALGYTSKGETVLSDLQKGIQNITEPQAAAIEAYLNSVRFAVFRHTEQLDMLIQMIGMQYGTTADNPVVNELKGIRMVLDSIDSRLDSVIRYDMGIAKIQVV